MDNKAEPDIIQNEEEAPIFTPPATRSQTKKMQNPMRTQYKTSYAPINISQDALYQVLGNTIATQPLCMLPRKFQQKEEHNPTDNITEHSAHSRVVHPVTKETITSYKTNGQPSHKDYMG